MSYDLIGYRARPGESAEEALERLEELAGDDAPPSQQEWDEISRVGLLLRAVDPAADVHQDRSAGVVEVTTPRFQVCVLAHEAAVTIPYWSDGSQESFAELGPYLAVLREAGFSLHDPQTDEPVDETRQVGEGYRASAEVVLPVLHRAAHEDPATTTGPPPPARRHWWSIGRRDKED